MQKDCTVRWLQKIDCKNEFFAWSEIWLVWDTQYFTFERGCGLPLAGRSLRTSSWGCQFPR